MQFAALVTINELDYRFKLDRSLFQKALDGRARSKIGAVCAGLVRGIGACLVTFSQSQVNPSHSMCCFNRWNFSVKIALHYTPPTRRPHSRTKHQPASGNTLKTHPHSTPSETTLL